MNIIKVIYVRSFDSGMSMDELREYEKKMNDETNKKVQAELPAEAIGTTSEEPASSSAP